MKGCLEKTGRIRRKTKHLVVQTWEVKVVPFLGWRFWEE